VILFNVKKGSFNVAFLKSKIEKKYLLLFLLISIIFSFEYFNSPILSGIYILFVLFFSLFGVFLIKKNMLSFRHPTFLLLMTFSIWLLITVAFSENLYLSLQRYLLIVIPTIILFIITFQTKNKKNLFIQFSKMIVTIGVILGLYGLFLSFFGQVVFLSNGTFQQFSLGPLRMQQRILGTFPEIRISSFTRNPNSLSIYIFLSIVSAYYLKKEKILKNKYFYAILIIEIATLLSAFSRSIIIVTLISLIVLYILTTKTTVRHTLYSTVFFILVMLGTFTFWNEILLKVENTRLSLDLNNRGDAWNILIDYALDNYVTGSGFGVAFEIILSNSIDFGAHNAYLLIIAESGLMGISIFVIFVASILIYGVNNIIRNQSNGNHFIYIFLFIIVIGILVHQMVEAQLFRLSPTFFIWVFCSAMLASKKEIQGAEVTYEENHDFYTNP